MRFVDTESLALIEVPDSQVHDKKYAILSHRWFAADEEVGYEDLERGQDVSHKRGYSKLQGFCEQALLQGFKYAWIDTCCINKASATELSTALNSMFTWYAEAALCIVYLADVRVGEIDPFARSEWSERGWTLQELIAPRKMFFFDRDWTFMGTKGDYLEDLSRITNVPRSILDHSAALDDFSVAQRMSWAAKRKTERIEDRAYSLLGIFDVSLEMIYGEREKAFIRLQERIIQYAADQSIFAWPLEALSTEALDSKQRYFGLLAPSPSVFSSCNEISKGTETKEFGMTNLGLAINVLLVPYYIGTYLAFLDCLKGPGRYCTIAIAEDTETSQWMRVLVDGGSSMPLWTPGKVQQGAKNCKIYVRQMPRPSTLLYCYSMTYGVWLREMNPLGPIESNIHVLFRTISPCEDRALLRPGMYGACAILRIDKTKASRDLELGIARWIIFGFDSSLQLVIIILGQECDALSPQHFHNFDMARRLGVHSKAHSWLFEYDFDVFIRQAGKIRLDTGQSTARGFRMYRHNTETTQTYPCRYFNMNIKVSTVPDVDPHAGQAASQKSIWTIDLCSTRSIADSDEGRWCC